MPMVLDGMGMPQCPFFKRNEATAVSCEGPVKNATAKLFFRSKKERQLFMKRCCCGNYQQCELYEKTVKKYD